MTTPPISRTEAATLLSQYLGALLRADIRVHDAEPTSSGRAITPTLAYFLSLLPRVTQRAVDGAELVFALPLVASGKGTSLSPAVAMVVNALLFERNEVDACVNIIEVPTFFYADGSTMVIQFWQDRLTNAVTVLQLSAQVRRFLTDALAGLKGA